MDNNIYEVLISNLIESVANDLDNKLPELSEMIKQLDTKNTWKDFYDNLDEIANNKENKINKLIHHIVKIYDIETIKSLVSNFIVNEVIKGSSKRKQLKRDLNITVPKIIDIEYDGTIDDEVIYLISYETISKVIQDGKDIGVHIYSFKTIENFRQQDLLKIAMKNPDCIFIFNIDFTTSDPKFLLSCKCMKNIIFIANLELGKAQYDKSIHKIYMNILKVLKDNKMVFGINTLLNSGNVNSVLKSNYVKKVISRGALFNIYSYDITSLYNDEIDFENVKSQISILKQKYPIIFYSYCKYLQNVIEVKISENQIIQVMDIDVLDKNTNKSIYDIIKLKKESKLDDKTSIKNNVISFAKHLFNRYKKNLDDDYSDLKVS